MSDFQFINVYSGRSPQDKDNTSNEPALWNVYLNEKENVYLIQKLDENNSPTFEKYKISPTFFGVNFRQVNNVPLNKATKKTMLSLKSESNKKLLPNSTLVTSAKDKQDTAKKTGEYFIQLSANKPEPLQKKSENAPKNTLSAKKATNEFNFNLNPDAPQKTKVDDFGLNSVQGDTKKAEQKKNANSQFKISTENIHKPQPEKTAKENTEPPAPTVKTSKTIQLTQTVQITQTTKTPESAKNLIEPQKAETAANAGKANGAAIIQTQGNDKKTETAQLSEKAEKSNAVTQIKGADIPQEKVFEKIPAEPAKAAEKAPEKTSAPSAASAPAGKETASSTQENEIPPTAPLAEKTAQENDAKAPEAENKDAKNKDAGEIDKITQTSEALLAPKDSDEKLTFSQKALKLDMSIRAEFQVSLTHWNSGKKNLAKRHFMDIINKQAKYEPAHKHVFTDIAIKLRKINLVDLALQASTKCTKLSPDDSHAFFNVARLYYELSRYDEANEFIDKALELEADLAPAKRLSYVIKECIRRKAHNR